jgi:uncharacterized coiled-coil protein SlyX
MLLNILVTFFRFQAVQAQLERVIRELSQTIQQKEFELDSTKQQLQALLVRSQSFFILTF